MVQRKRCPRSSNDTVAEKIDKQRTPHTDKKMHKKPHLFT